MKAKHLEFFFIVEKECKLHAQTSTLQTLSVAFKSYPIGLCLRLDFLDFHSKETTFFNFSILT